MFTHDCVSIEQLLWPVVWAVVASYDWLHDRSLIATTYSTIINRTIDLFPFYLIVRLMNHQPYDNLQPIAGQSQYAIASENRVDWSYFDLLSLVARFQNRAIRCDWGFNRLLRLATECREPFLTRILTGPPPFSPLTTHKGMRKVYSNPDPQSSIEVGKFRINVNIILIFSLILWFFFTPLSTGIAENPCTNVAVHSEHTNIHRLPHIIDYKLHMRCFNIRQNKMDRAISIDVSVNVADSVMVYRRELLLNSMQISRFPTCSSNFEFLILCYSITI
jgi:hypothetical protein